MVLTKEQKSQTNGGQAVHSYKFIIRNKETALLVDEIGGIYNTNGYVEAVDINTRDSIYLDDNWQTEAVIERAMEGTFELYFANNSFIKSRLYGSTIDVTLGTPVAITDEEVKLDLDLGEGLYAGVLQYPSFDTTYINTFVTLITIKSEAGAGGTTYVEDTDYTVAGLTNGMTRIDVISGSSLDTALSKGEIFFADYTYVPMVSSTSDFEPTKAKEILDVLLEEIPEVNSSDSILRSYFFSGATITSNDRILLGSPDVAKDISKIEIVLNSKNVKTTETTRT